MNILITGANRGLGLSLVQEALQRQHTVLATARTAGAELLALQKQYPQKLWIYQMDVVQEASVVAAAQSIAAAHGTVDVLINNAAVLLESKYYQGDPVADMALCDYEATLNVNVMGVIRTCHYFAPLLYKSACPWLMNITSEGAMLKPMGSHYIAYSISKYALNMYTQKIRNYYKEQRPGWPLHIYMVHPGRMFTDMGVENAQIQPAVPAKGILDILDGNITVEPMDIPFIDYLGKPMPDHFH